MSIVLSDGRGNEEDGLTCDDDVSHMNGHMLVCESTLCDRVGEDGIRRGDSRRDHHRLELQRPLHTDAL